MSDLFDEIKQDIQQERLAKLWTNFGNYIIGGIIGVVVITAASVGYKSYSLAKYESMGTKLYNAYIKENGPDKDAAIQEYTQIVQGGGSSLTAIASMRKASLLADKGEVDKATEIYKDVSENDKTPLEIKELAEILYLQNAIEFSADTALNDRLEELSASNGPFKYSAKEILAFAKFKNGEYNEAKKLFTDLNDDASTPTRMRGRSGEMISAINAKIENNNE